MLWECLCQALAQLPDAEAILAANAEQPYCNAQGCFDIPLHEPPRSAALPLLVAAAALTVAALVRLRGSRERFGHAISKA